MKKSFYLAALAVVALGSCSSDDIVVSDPIANGGTDNGLVPVIMSVGTPSLSVVTRGTGTVGNIVDGSGAWNGECVRVLMTQIPEYASDPDNPVFTYTYRKDGETPTKLFDNTFYCLPQVENEQIRLMPQGIETRYYPSTGSSNFFAYYIDDAVNAENGLEETVQDGDIAAETKDVPADESEDGIAYKYVDFEMDGTQDIMAGMATPPSDSRYPGFSAEAARHNVHPSVQMHHLLTRFTFSVVAGNKNAEGVSVDQISVKSSAKGKLKVAYDVDKEWWAENAETYMNNLIDWTPSGEEKAELILKERAKDGDGEYIYHIEEQAEKSQIQDMTPYVFENLPENYQYTSRTEATRLGDAIFVRPNQASYQLKVTTSYEEHPELTSDPIERNIEVRGPQDQLIEFEQGKSYHVTIVVYGLSDIKVFAELTPWVDGGDVPRINEDIFEDEAFTTNTLEHIHTAKLDHFVATEEEGVTYDKDNSTFTTTANEELGVKILATDGDAVKGQELMITFAEAAQVKVIVKFFDETQVEMTMEEAAEVLRMAIDPEKYISEIQILLSEAGSVTLSSVVINPVSTEPEEVPEP